MYTIYIGSDHAGYQTKEVIKQSLPNNYRVVDVGCNSPESCHYPDVAHSACQQYLMENNENSRIILICATGTGMNMVANKYPGVRCCHGHTISQVTRSRIHNDANGLALGAKSLDISDMQGMVSKFLETEFEDSGRHRDRVNKIEPEFHKKMNDNFSWMETNRVIKVPGNSKEHVNSVNVVMKPVSFVGQNVETEDPNGEVLLNSETTNTKSTYDVIEPPPRQNQYKPINKEKTEVKYEPSPTSSKKDNTKKFDFTSVGIFQKSHQDKLKEKETLEKDVKLSSSPPLTSDIKMEIKKDISASHSTNENETLKQQLKKNEAKISKLETEKNQLLNVTMSQEIESLKSNPEKIETKSSPPKTINLSSRSVHMPETVTTPSVVANPTPALLAEFNEKCSQLEMTQQRVMQQISRKRQTTKRIQRDMIVEMANIYNTEEVELNPGNMLTYEPIDATVTQVSNMNNFNKDCESLENTHQGLIKNVTRMRQLTEEIDNHIMTEIVHIHDNSPTPIA